MQYANDFMFFIIKSIDSNKHIYCSGVNITRFSALTKGRHRLGQNPAVKGLQSLNHDIRAILIANNAVPETVKHLSCSSMIPLTNELWYTESFLINNYNESIGDKILQTAPAELLRKMFKSMILNENVPDNLSAQEMQDYLYALIERLSNN